MWEPFGAVPANTTASWRGGPDERGTLNILSICIITLLLCAYTSLHLDIPKYGKATWKHQFWRRALWVCAGLGAPELVAFVAFRQMLFARGLKYKMDGHLKNLSRSRSEVGPSTSSTSLLTKSVTTSAATPSDVESALTERDSSRMIQPTIDAEHETTKKGLLLDHASERINPWTRVHSHFALMGGFVFEARKQHQGILGTEAHRLTLTPVALRKLAENLPTLLPDISESTILDKSKANGLAKFIVCLQATWFIAQTVGRSATGLPISLLEMNTLLHAFCCLLIYIAWWHKPLDIEEPYVISIRDEYTAKVCAWMLTQDDLEDDVGSLSRKSSREQIIRSKEANKRYGRPEQLLPPDYAQEEDSQRASSSEALIKVFPGQNVHGFVVYSVIKRLNQKVHTIMSLSDIERLRLAQILRQEGDAWHFEAPWLLQDGASKMLTQGTSLATLKTPDQALKKWRRSNFLTPEAVLWTGLLVAGSLYGAIHLLAWNGPFPSKTERLLWRISALIISSPLGVILCFFVLVFFGFLLVSVGLGLMRSLNLMHGASSMLKSIPKWLKKTGLDEVLWFLFGVLLVLLAAVYIAARVYLVVECFINIAHLPDAVFQEPKWNNYIPHFGAG